MKILFIGSDREIADMTCKILRRNHYDAVAVIGKEEAIGALGQYDPALVLFDCEMSEDDRTAVVQAVKKGQEPPRLLMISGEKADEIPALVAGADDWVQKPYRMDVLLARMAALLRQK